MTSITISESKVRQERVAPVVHKRAWVVHRKGTPQEMAAGLGRVTHSAVAYCRTSSTGKPVTTTDDWGKVNCHTCSSIREGRAGL